MGRQYNLTNIRTFLTEGFIDEELRRFCFDVPSFRPVYEQLSSSTGKTQIVHQLLEYAERKGLIEFLLNQAEKHNPTKYEEHKPYSDDVTPTVVITSENWQLPGGNKPLSASDDVEQTITAVRQAFPLQDREMSGVTQFGPLLLEQLLQNYQTYQKQWQELTPEESIKDVNLKCYNQREIIRRIRFASPLVRVVELSGPSGIGKSHVLKALREEEDRDRWTGPTEMRGKWKYVQVNTDGTFQQIMTNLLKGLGSSHTPTSGSLPERLAECLMDLVQTEGVDHILFMLDDANEVSDQLLIQLVGEDGPVGHTVRNALSLVPHVFLRLVIATRRPRFPQSLRIAHNIRGLLQLQMNTLGFEDVRDMLHERILSTTGSLSHLSEETIDLMTEYIFDISGGHPGIINTILHKLVDSRFAGSPEKYPHRFRPVVLQIVQRDIIGDLSWKEYLLLNVLSVFRRFHLGLVRELLKAGLLPADVLGEKDPTERILASWLVNMCETPALIRRTPTDPAFPFTVHPVLRHVLPMDLETMSPQILYQLHCEVYRIYDRELSEHDTSGVRLRMPLITRPTYTMEALYHYVQSQLVKFPEKGEAPVEEFINLAKKYWQLYLDSYNVEEGGFVARNPFAFHEQWEQDEELQDRVRQFSGGVEALKALQQLFSQII